MGVWAQRLIGELEALERWPNPAHEPALRAVSRGIALRDGDEETLRALTRWDRGRRAEQRFVVDSMPSRITSAYTSLTFGRQPKFGAAAEADQERLDELVEENNFRSELRRARRTASSEGEAWWRWRVDLDASPVPQLDWYSRTAVYPLWSGWRLVALAFVSRLDDTEERDGKHAWRHFEVHDVDRELGGTVTHVLFREHLSRVAAAMEGQEFRPGAHGLGERVPLSEARDDEVARLSPTWVHGIRSMLGGRVVNLEATDPTVGKSDYVDAEHFLLELSVGASVASQNMELTARRRVIVPETEVEPDSGAVDVGEQVYVGASVDEDLGGQRSGAPFRVLEYSFDATAMNVYLDRVERVAATRSGMDVQYLGLEPAEGRAESGTALRIRLIPTRGSADERDLDWDHRLPRLMAVGQQLGALPPKRMEGDVLVPGTGGAGMGWGQPAELPSIDRGEALPEDRVEGTERRATAVEARIMSRERAVREDHPEWSDDEVRAELRRIGDDEESSASASAAQFGATIPPSRQGNETAPADGGGDEDEGEPEGEPEA